MQIGDRHSAVTGGRMLAKVSSVRHVPGTKFGAPGDMLAIVDADWGRALGSTWRGQMLAKVPCVRHVPSTDFASIFRWIVPLDRVCRQQFVGMRMARQSKCLLTNGQRITDH